MTQCDAMSARAFRVAVLCPIVVTLLGISGAHEATAGTASDGRILITEPITIDAPGSYVLGNNIASSAPCIILHSSYVTIDLNGFAIMTPRRPHPELAVKHPIIGGVDPTQTAISAIWDAERALHDIVIQNGTIVGFDNGVMLAHCRAVTVSHLRLHTVGRPGVGSHPVSTGDAATIEYCKLDHCEGVQQDINAGSDCTIRGNTIAATAGIAILAQRHCLITDNVIDDINEDGIDTGDDCIIMRNQVRAIHDQGIRAGEGCTVADNLVVGLGQRDGIGANTQSIVTGNRISAFDRGIIASVCAIRGNVIASNTIGILSDGQCNVVGNTIVNNERGIRLNGGGNVMRDNDIRGSRVAGIWCETHESNAYIDNTFNGNAVDVSGGCAQGSIKGSILPRKRR